MTRGTQRPAEGICYLVGAGPGDPDLLTLRGRACIEAADVVVYDYLSSPELLRHAGPQAELIYAGKKSREHTLTQDQINELLVARCREGKTVTRLKGGDPFVFGRGGEEAQMLARAGIRFEIIPGISSALAGPAYAGIPVTHRACNSQLTLFTGHEDPEKGPGSVDCRSILRKGGVAVMLMGVERLGAIAREMLEGGAACDLPVALIRWATTGRQETLTGELGTIAEAAERANFRAPAVAVFGEVVRLREELNWFERRPLFGQRVVVTRTRQQASALSERLRHLGAEVLEIPTIRIEPPPDRQKFVELVRDAYHYDWLIFTSPNGVDSFFDVFYRIYEDARSIGGVRIAVMGPGTAERLRRFHLKADLIPSRYVAEGMLEAFSEQCGSMENLRFLWVKAERTREVLGRELTERGAILDEAVAYRTVPETGDPLGTVQRFVEEGADLITFTSSSTVECFLDLKLPLPKDIRVVSIGPVTSETALRRGLEVHREAARHDIPGLVEAVCSVVRGE